MSGPCTVSEHMLIPRFAPTIFSCAALSRGSVSATTHIRTSASSRVIFALYLNQPQTRFASMASATTFYDFKPKDKKGNEYPLTDFKGKVVLVVNTASKCGFTPQFEGLEKLYKGTTQHACIPPLTSLLGCD